eukprot:4943919-Pyramimonas_sp.AAC.1
MPPPLQEHECPQRCLLGCGYLGEEIFIDGSGVNPDVEWMTRAGWAVVSLRQCSEQVSAVAYGPVPGPVQSTGLAEHC